MKFDGMTFVRNHHISFKPSDLDPNYVVFYYPKTNRMIELTDWYLPRTDMAYAKDGRVLLVKNGQVWTSGTRKRLMNTTTKASE